MAVEGKRYCVIGGSGFAGRRLVEMLVQRGAKEVVSFDLREPDSSFKSLEFLTPEEKKRVKYVKGDLTKYEDVLAATKDVDCVFLIAALVGPYYPQAMYYKVNYEGVLNVLQCLKDNNVNKLIYSSSPSTRFDGNDISGKKECELSVPDTFLEAYAETKWLGEKAVSAANSDELMTVSLAPHQIYGPRDSLFLPNFMKASYSGKLRVIGSGLNEISMCYVDNYCEALIKGVEMLYPGSKILGKFYIITDGGKVNMWRALDEACVSLGHASLFSKFKVPAWLMFIIAYFLQFITMATGYRFRITPFTVKMLVINRWFDVSASQEELGFVPVKTFKEAWPETIEWFRQNEDYWKAKAANTFH